MNLELLSNILLGYWKLTQQYMAFWYNNFGPQNLSNCGLFEDWFVPLHISEFRSPFDSEFAPLNSGKVQLLTAIKLDPPGQWTSEKYLALETSLLAMEWSETLLWDYNKIMSNEDQTTPLQARIDYTLLNETSTDGLGYLLQINVATVSQCGLSKWFWPNKDNATIWPTGDSQDLGLLENNGNENVALAITISPVIGAALYKLMISAPWLMSFRLLLGCSIRPSLKQNLAFEKSGNDKQLRPSIQSNSTSIEMCSQPAKGNGFSLQK